MIFEYTEIADAAADLNTPPAETHSYVTQDHIAAIQVAAGAFFVEGIELLRRPAPSAAVDAGQSAGAVQPRPAAAAC